MLMAAEGQGGGEQAAATYPVGGQGSCGWPPASLLQGAVIGKAGTPHAPQVEG